MPSVVKVVNIHYGVCYYYAAYASSPLALDRTRAHVLLAATICITELAGALKRNYPRIRGGPGQYRAQDCIVLIGINLIELSLV